MPKIVHGGCLNDFIYDQSSSDADYIYGYEGNDNIHGHDGNDVIFGGAGDDDLFGGGDNDVLKGGGGADFLSGGGGGASDIDTAAYDESPAGVMVSLITNLGFGGDAAGDQLYNIENLRGSVYADNLGGNNAVNVLHGLHGNDVLRGGGNDDILWGGIGNDDLYGMGDDDTLYGEDGNDDLDGGPGADTMYGGSGNDTYVVDHGGDVVHEDAAVGNDIVRTYVSWTLTAGADVETLRTTNDAGMGAINLTGNETINTVRGNDGSNVIGGGDGDDWLTGLGGADSFRFDTPLNAATNVDIISDFNFAGDDTILLDDVVFSAFANGPLADARFVVGTAAQDANDNIIYDSSTGALYYDSDGTGAAAAVQFAHVNAGTAITHLDFIVV